MNIIIKILCVTIFLLGIAVSPIFFLLNFSILLYYLKSKKFTKKCETCDMIYDSLCLAHCCYCKNNYPSFFFDGDIYTYKYLHCCKCKNIYDEDSTHECKQKTD